MHDKGWVNVTEFLCTTRLYTGPNALLALRNFPADRVMVVTDAYFSQNGKAAKIASMVPGSQSMIFDRVTPDPTAELAAEAAAVCRKFKPQLLIAFGGGSPMDCAKAVRIASEEPMAFVAIPTTSGSGSEVTSFSILTHSGIKHPLVDPAMRPDAAILDDSLLEDLPQNLIADTGMDLLAHSMEAAVARGRSAFSDAMAAAAARTVFSCLPASYQGDRSVRRRLHEAAAMAGVAFENAGLGACHAMAHAMGGVFHLPHGRLCAMVLPHVMAANEPSAGEAYQAMAAACGMTNSSRRMAVRSLSSAIVRLRSSLKLPATLSQAGISRETALQNREKVLQAAMEDSCLRTNPAPMTPETLAKIYEAVL